MDELVEIEIDDPDDFLVIKETLTRIGIPSEKEGKKILTQSCHILHKRGRYFIVHFKELFMLDGRETDISDEDKSRRNTVAYLLDHWGLCKILNTEQVAERLPSNFIKIVPYKEKKEWDLRQKYEVGKKRREKNAG